MRSVTDTRRCIYKPGNWHALPRRAHLCCPDGAVVPQFVGPVEWGVVDPLGAPPACGGAARGALTSPLPLPAAREVYLLQRTKGAQGKRLGKTTGWVHRASLKAKGVHQLSGVNYERISDEGLHISFGSDRARPRLLAVDNVVICAGQEPVRELEPELRRNGIEPHIIGGAARDRRCRPGSRTDAKRAIRQGTELAARL